MESINRELFLAINATPDSPEWLLLMARWIANDLIFIVPLLLVIMWLWSDKRKLVINTAIALAIAVLIAKIIRVLYPHARPFVDGIGHQFLYHDAVSSFPSNHGTVIFTFAIAFLFWDRMRNALALLFVALAIAWSRVYLGIHWPLDMAGGMGVAIISCLIAQLVWQLSGQKLLYWAEFCYRSLFSVLIRKGWIKN